MKTLIATVAFAVAIAFAPAHAINTSISTPAAAPNMSVKPAQANCSFTYRSECNGYCWVCY